MGRCGNKAIVIAMCERRGFKLKLISRKTVSKDQKSRNQDLDMGNLQNERALGVHWNIENDYLG